MLASQEQRNKRASNKKYQFTYCGIVDQILRVSLIIHSIVHPFHWMIRGHDQLIIGYYTHRNHFLG